MKKIIVLMAVVACAALSQAAAIKWGNTSSSKITDLTGTTMTVANATAYALTFYLVDEGGNKVASLSSINSMSAGVLSGTGMTYSYTYGSDYSSGTTFSILGQMTVDGKDYEMTVGTYALTAVNNSGTDTFTWAAGTYGGSMWKATTPVTPPGPSGDIPEPTSGLLLVVGGALLALRRRQK